MHLSLRLSSSCIPLLHMYTAGFACVWKCLYSLCAFPSPLMRFIVLALFALLGPVAGDLNLLIWNNTALAPLGAAQVSVTPSANLSGFSNYTSARLTGSITLPPGEVEFTVVGDGSILMWIDDHLVIDGLGASSSPRLLGPVTNITFTGASQTFRLDYIHNLGASVLEVQANRAPIPASALSTSVTPFELERQKLKDGLQCPRVPWQTYNNPTMGTHVLMPQGFGLDTTLAVLSGEGEGKTLGRIIVYRRSNPAITHVGPHSYNGSDYSEVTVSSWSGRACSVTLQTTVVGSDLYYLATSNGSDCSRMALLVTPIMLWERSGTFSFPSSGQLVASLPGFPSVSVFAVGASPVSFPKSANSWALPLSSSFGAVGFSTGAASTVSAMQSAISAAQSRQLSYLSKYGPSLSPLYEPMQSVIAWNTMFTPYEGVVTPVSRGWDFGAGYVIFDWDNYFLSYMASLDEESLPIACSNVMQISLARTVRGFVPNFASGTHVSLDRTEPQIGAYVALQIFNKWGPVKVGWVMDVIMDSLNSWNDWVWTSRRGEGVLAGSDGHADLVVLGSDPYPGCGSDYGCGTLQDARFESGLDNSPMYDSPPVEYNTTTSHMTLYDVGMTALYVSDTKALITLATARNRTDLLPTLQSRLARVTTAMNAHLWDDANGLYTNVLYNGSFYPRISPTSLFPLISGSATTAQATASMATATSPLGFCMNETYVPVPEARMVIGWWDEKHDNAACISGACTQTVVNAAYNFIRVEAVALSASAPSAPGLIPLGLWYSASRGDYALTNSTTVPPDGKGGYVFIGQEGWAWSSPPAGEYGWPTTELTLWYSSARNDYQTCGSPGCLTDTNVNKYEFIGSLGFAFSGTGAANMPCVFSGNSIIRSDPAFFDNNYWRGRIWGPHLQLMYWGLSEPTYKDIPEVASARAALVNQSAALLLQNWGLFRQVTENFNGIVGVGEDVGNADPFYHWGALAGFLSFQEAGVY